MRMSEDVLNVVCAWMGVSSRRLDQHFKRFVRWIRIRQMAGQAIPCSSFESSPPPNHTFKLMSGYPDTTVLGKLYRDDYKIEQHKVRNESADWKLTDL